MEPAKAAMAELSSIAAVLDEAVPPRSRRQLDLAQEQALIVEEFIDLSGAHERLTHEFELQAAALQAAEELNRANERLLETEANTGALVEALQEELSRLVSALGGDWGGADAADLPSSATTLAAASEIQALRQERDRLQTQLQASERQHSEELAKQEADHAAQSQALRDEYTAVIEKLSRDNAQVVKHLQEDAEFASLARSSSAADAACDAVARAAASDGQRQYLSALQQKHDSELEAVRRSHAEQLAAHDEELRAVSFLVEVPLMKKMTASELRSISAIMA